MCGPTSAVPKVPPVPVKFTVAPGAMVPSELNVREEARAIAALWLTMMFEAPAEAFRVPTVSVVPTRPFEFRISVPPLKVMGVLLPMRLVFWLPLLSRFKVAPVLIVIPEALAALPLAPESSTVPLSTSIAPLKVLVPESVNVPLPSFVKPPVPLITPESVVEVPLLPAARVALPSVTLPAPAMEPTVLLKPARS